MTTVTPSILRQDLLEACRERAPLYDRENRFFQEDFDALKAAAISGWRFRRTSAASA